MIEEAVGTMMYETKKQQCQKTIEKKDNKLREINEVSTCKSFEQLMFGTLSDKKV
jgi:chromosome segregation ATPase